MVVMVLCILNIVFTTFSVARFPVCYDQLVVNPARSYAA